MSWAKIRSCTKALWDKETTFSLPLKILCGPGQLFDSFPAQMEKEKPCKKETRPCKVSPLVEKRAVVKRKVVVIKLVMNLRKAGVAN